jgi:hypothetical protein
VSECGKELCRVLCVRKTASADGTIGSGGPYHRSRWATWVFLARLYLVRQKGIAPVNLSPHLARLLARAANDAGNRPPVPVNIPARR